MTARDLIKRMFEAGETPKSIAAHFGGEVSERTVYRWAKGDHEPRNPQHLMRLEEIAMKGV